MKAVLGNNTMAFGFSVYVSFDFEVASNGVVPMLILPQCMLGRHEVLAVGYLDDSRIIAKAG